jgi:hypothetical protein
MRSSTKSGLPSADAIQRAVRVLPTPGGPIRAAERVGLMPRLSSSKRSANYGMFLLHLVLKAPGRVAPAYPASAIEYDTQSRISRAADRPLLRSVATCIDDPPSLLGWDTVDLPRKSTLWARGTEHDDWETGRGTGA